MVPISTTTPKMANSRAGVLQGRYDEALGRLHERPTGDRSREWIASLMASCLQCQFFDRTSRNK